MLKVAIVGCGPRGREHAQAVRELNGAALVGVCDQRPEALRSAAAAFGMAGFASVGELMGRTGAEVVVVATPAEGRGALTTEIASYPGVRALIVEKPMALTLAEGRALVDVCQRQGIYLTVCHQLRFSPEFVALKQALDAGELGEVEFFRGVCYGNLWSQGVHLIDMFRWLAGPRRLMWAMSQAADDPDHLERFGTGDQTFRKDQNHPGPMWMTHHLAWEGGLRATLETGLLYSRSRVFCDDWLQKRVTVVGTRGLAESQGAGYCKKLVEGQSTWKVMESGLAQYQGATRAFYHELLGVLRGHGSHRNEGRDALQSLEATIACARSAAQSKLVPLPLEDISLLPVEPTSSSPALVADNVSAVHREYQAPLLSIVLPLRDHRGLAVEAVASWTQGQTLPADQYEVILVGDGADGHLEAHLQGLLRPGDRFLRHHSTNELCLYDLGARQARGKWLLFTEPHCIAEPICLEELAAYLQSHACDGACLRSTGITSNFMGRLEERLYDEGFVDFARRGDWRKVILRGFALDRRMYLETGGFEHRYGRFSEWSLAARLHAQGRRLGYAAGASVRHLYTPSFKDLLPFIYDFSEGEIAYRLTQSKEFCERYFGQPPEWNERGSYQKGALRAVCGALLKQFLHPWKGWGRKARTARTLLRQLPAALFGWHGRALAQTWRLRWAMLRTYFWRWHERRSERAYRDVYQRATTLGRLRALARAELEPVPLVRGPGSWAMADLPEDSLFGFHSLESHRGGHFRWTQAIAALPLALPPGRFDLILETRGVRAAVELQSLDIWCQGRRVDYHLDRDTGQIVISLDVNRDAADTPQWLVLACMPLRPWKVGVADQRELGMPIYSLQITAASATVPAASPPCAAAAA